MKFAWIEEQGREFPVTAMCRALAVSDSGYCAWRKSRGRKAGGAGKTESRRAGLIALIRTVYLGHDRKYGSPRVYKDLIEMGVRACENTVAKLVRRHGFRAKKSPAFVPQTTDSGHGLPVAENLLASDPT